MADLKAEDVKHLAKLARIDLSDEEISTFQTQLSAILDYVEQLDKADTSDLEPTSQVTGLTSVSRGDDEDTSDTMPTSELLEQAPDTQDSNLKVPRVL